ncbi:MAG: hypothetical protein M1839_003851 [Geoglossum umbratile]|nr:MAG: hypothetical protein M1839_003851 [Geoglossum umbratile]
MSMFSGRAFAAFVPAIVFHMAEAFLPASFRWVVYCAGVLPGIGHRPTALFWWLSMPVVAAGVTPSHAYAGCCFVDSLMLGIPFADTLAFTAISALLNFAPPHLYTWLYPAVAFDFDWYTCTKVAIISVFLLAPRLYFGLDSGTVHTGMPENHAGIWMAIIFHCCEIIFPSRVQWIIYATVARGAPRPSLTDVEYAGISILVWAYSSRPAVAFGANLVASTIIHPLRRRIGNEVRPSPLLLRQRVALFWFGIVYLPIRILRQLLGANFDKVVGRIVVGTLLAFFVFGGCVLWVFNNTYLPETAEVNSMDQLPDEQSVLLKMVRWALAIWSHNRTCCRDAQGATEHPARYTYVPLRRDDSTIRLLQIHSSFFSSRPIKCHLIQVPLRAALRPNYTAISYRWDTGSGEGPREILLNGVPCSVLPTVYSILRARRSRIRKQYLWIDSVCINQEDRTEKAKQVQLMRHIYENCTGAIGWVGAERSDVGDAFGAIRRLMTGVYRGKPSDEYNAVKMINRIISSRYLQDISADNPPGGPPLRYDAESLIALEKLVTNPFFERVWIIQEVAAAPRFELLYGGLSIPWENYARAMAIVANTELRNFTLATRAHDDEFQPPETPGIDNALIMENLRQWYGARGAMQPLGPNENRLLSLEDTLKLSLRFRATLEVDKMFALLGLIADRDELDIFPDYETDRRDAVFIDVTQRLIRKALRMGGNPFRAMRLAGIGQPRKLTTLPSWVPDWTAKLETCVLSHQDAAFDYRACRNFNPAIDFLDIQSAIVCRGILVDNIASQVHISKFHSSYTQGDPLPFQQALRLAKESGALVEYPNGSLEDAFWRTTVADIGPTSRPASQAHVGGWRDHIKKCETVIENSSRSPADARRAADIIRTLKAMNSEDGRFTHLLSSELSAVNPGHAGDFCSVLGRAQDQQAQAPLFTTGRNFCVTQRGHMGLVPALSEDGDAVVIFLGATTPHILRQVVHTEDGKNSLKRYKLVGEAYIHGMMDDEMFRGGPEILDFMIV